MDNWKKDGAWKDEGGVVRLVFGGVGVAQLAPVVVARLSDLQNRRPRVQCLPPLSKHLVRVFNLCL